MANIQQLINQHHNPDLVKINESPNGNYQILLFQDGEICHTKGGWAFMNRTLFTKNDPLPNVNFPMPIKSHNSSYAILPSYEIALEIREEMKRFYNSN